MNLHALLGATQLSQDIRKSRFLAKAAPVQSAEAALEFVQQVGDPTATHNCWAYRIGQQYRFSDDGEPGGTAGKPILQAIDGQGLDQTVVVVTRWYGGTKLGAGGLMRAYGGCAAECLRLAPRTPLIDLTELRVHCDYASSALLYSRLAQFDAERINEVAHNDGIELHLRLPRDQADPFSSFVQDMTRGLGQIREVPSDDAYGE